MPKVSLPRILIPGDPPLADTVAVELVDGRLANAWVEVVDPDAPAPDAALDEAGRRCVQAFAVVDSTVGLVRRSDILGKRMAWPAGRPLQVVCVEPAVGANARYVPEQHRLLLGVGQDADGRARYAADDPDVVAHETGHALLHALAPDLVAAWHPESLATHEAVADLVTVLTLLESPTFRDQALGSLANVPDAQVLEAIAESFAPAIGDDAARSLDNDAVLPARAGLLLEPHALSAVLSGAVWTFVQEGLTAYIQQESRFDLLAALARQLRRLLLRALVYAPPGELTFGDVARLLVGADRAVHGMNHRGQERRLNAIFRARGVLVDEPDLDAPEVVIPPLPAGGPDDAWLRATEAALGRGPCDAVDVRRWSHLVYRGPVKGEWQEETLVRLAWRSTSPSPVGPIQVTRGATVVASPASGAILATIRTGGERPADELRREAWVGWLVDNHVLRLGEGPLGALPLGLAAALHLHAGA